MRLACSTWMMPGNNFTEKIRSAADFGFEGVEIRLFDHEAKPKKIREIKNALKDNGLNASSLLMPGETFRRTLCDEDAKAAKIEHALISFLAIYEAFAYFPDSLPILIASFFSPELGDEFPY